MTYEGLTLPHLLRPGLRLVFVGYNPDGFARGSRKNARGVDLNRNYPRDWKDLDGGYESGPRAMSEPETRAMRTFLREVSPRTTLVFHQPLYGVGATRPGMKTVRALARGMALPVRDEHEHVRGDDRATRR